LTARQLPSLPDSVQTEKRHKNRADYILIHRKLLLEYQQVPKRKGKKNPKELTSFWRSGLGALISTSPSTHQITTALEKEPKKDMRARNRGMPIWDETCLRTGMNLGLPVEKL